MNRIRVYLSRNRYSIGMALVSGLLFVIVLLLPVKSKPFGDGDFHEETKVLAAFVHGRADYNQLAITKAPGPVLYYLIPYVLCSPDSLDSTFWRAAVAWNALVLTLTTLVLFTALSRKWGERTGLIFVSLLFALPLHIYYSMGVLAESLAFLGVCWMIIGYLSNKSARFYAGFVGGIMALVLARPNAGLVIPILGVGAVLAYWQWRDEYAKKVLIACCGAFVGIVIILTGVKMLPNERATLKQEEYLSFVMHHGRFQFRTETFDWRFWDNKTRADSKDYQAWQASTRELNKIVRHDSLPYATVYYRWVFQDMMNHPLTVAKQFVVRLLFGNTLQVSSKPAEEFAVAGIRGKGVYWVVHVAMNLFNYTCMVFAVSFLVKGGRTLQFWPLISIILALWLFHGLIYMEQRYLFPVRPVILLFAAQGIATFFKPGKSHGS